MSILPLRSCLTCWAVVGLGRVARLALGAAMGVSASLMRAWAILWFGILIATVSCPPVVILGILGAAFSTRVSGPGQNFFISVWVCGGSFSAIVLMSSFFAMWTMIGLSSGLFLAL